MNILITGGCGFLWSNLASYGINKNDVENIIKDNSFDAVFHLDGQVVMTTSI